METYKPKQPTKDRCIYDPENGGLQCFRRNCETCGWNPEIAEKRKQEKFEEREKEND